MPTVSWVLLTHNRPQVVEHCYEFNLANAGAEIDEIVWVDNGSDSHAVLDSISRTPDTLVLYDENRGVARGYNTGLGLASKDYIVITGCDMRMPKDWLATFLRYATEIPQTGVACMYSVHWTAKPERMRGKYGLQEVNGLPIVQAMPLERRIFKRSMLEHFGYFPESFGLYGWDDLAFAERKMKVCNDMGLLYYVIPDHVATHLGTEGTMRFDGKDSPEYHAFKQREALNPAKKIELQRLRDLGWPRYSPFY